jgi:hypothetical protein
MQIRTRTAKGGVKKALIRALHKAIIATCFKKGYLAAQYNKHRVQQVMLGDFAFDCISFLGCKIYNISLSLIFKKMKP